MDRVREMSLRSFEIQPRFCFIKKHAGICEFFTVTGDFSDKKQLIRLISWFLVDFHVKRKKDKGSKKRDFLSQVNSFREPIK